MDGEDHVFSINGHKFRFGVRDLCQAAITILACVGLYFTLVARTNKNTDDINSAAIERGKMWVEIGRMNDSGTRHSHEVDQSQQQNIDLLKQNFAEVNAELQKLGPKVDKIDTYLLWLMAKQLEKR